MEMTIEEYRAAILKVMLEAKDKNGNPRMDEREANFWLKNLRDEELADGMPFNTPEDVAEVLLQP